MTKAVISATALAVLALFAGAFASAQASRQADAGITAEAIADAVRAVERERVVWHAVRALDRYQERWNTRTPIAWARSLHFPHVRPSARNFTVTHSAEEYVQGVNFERTLATGWHRSQWDELRVLQVGENKAHVAGQYTRYTLEGDQIFSAIVTYIVTEQDGHWGIQSRFGAGRLGLPDARRAENEAAARAAVEAYFEALNSLDHEAWAATLNYPHVRVAGGTVEMWETAEEYLAGLQPGRQRTWFHTGLDSMDVVQVGANGANVALQFSRHNSEGETMSSYEAVYLVTRRDGRWAVQARSSFAP